MDSVISLGYGILAFLAAYGVLRVCALPRAELVAGAVALSVVGGVEHRSVLFGIVSGALIAAVSLLLIRLGWFPPTGRLQEASVLALYILGGEVAMMNLDDPASSFMMPVIGFLIAYAAGSKHEPYNPYEQEEDGGDDPGPGRTEPA